MSVETEDAFQKELVELFIQEAQEWLQQIHVALDELQQAPPSERHRDLAQTIKVGITNLGGSAATLNLSDVERASFSALPFVEAVQDPSARISADDFIALCKQLGHVHGALTRATGVAFDEDSAPAPNENPPPMIATKAFLVLLRGLQDQRTASRPIPSQCGSDDDGPGGGIDGTRGGTMQCSFHPGFSRPVSRRRSRFSPSRSTRTSSSDGCPSDSQERWRCPWPTVLRPA